MLPKKRLLFILIIVALISSIFMIYNFNEHNTKMLQFVNKKVPEELLVTNGSDRYKQSTTYYVVGSTEKELYKDIFFNVNLLFNDLKLSYKKIANKNINMEHVLKDDVVIFCVDTVHEYVNLKELELFIKNGGKVILAAGISESNNDSFLNPIIGITEKHVKESYTKFKFTNDFLPLQTNAFNYDVFHAYTRISIKEDAVVYIEENEKKVPIVYTYHYGNGTSGIINGTLLTDYTMTGILTGLIGELLQDFIYPTLAVKSVFLDNFPMVTYINDKACMKLYGRNTESFVRDIVWPEFQGMTLRQKAPYTSSVLSISSSEDDFLGINKSLFNTIGKSALQFNGELVYAANTRDSNQIVLNNVFLDGFHGTFPNYKIQSIALMSKTMPDEAYNLFDGDIKSIRGKLGSQDTHLSYNKDCFSFPAVTVGNDMENTNIFRIMSTFASYGMVSHVFDINTMIAVDDKTASWDTYKKEIGNFESEILSKIHYIKGMTISQTSSKVNSYVNLQFGFEKIDNQLKLKANHFIKGQTFFYKTKDKIISADGLEYKEIGTHYYMLTLNEQEATIQLQTR